MGVMLPANVCQAEMSTRPHPTTSNEEQSRGIMEFQEDKIRNVEDTRGSIAAGRMAEDLSSLGKKAKSNIANATDGKLRPRRRRPARRRCKDAAASQR